MLTFKLAWRSLWRNKRRTLITISSIALGLVLAVIFIAIAEGMYAKLIDDAVRIQGGHITLEHPDYREAPAVDLVISGDPDLRQRIASLAGVEKVKALILGQGVAKSGAGGVGVAVIGIEPQIEINSSPLAKQVVRGSYLEDPAAPEVLIGAQLAKQLKLELGKKMVLTSNDASGNLVEELVRVKGIFEVGVEEIDGYLVQVPIGFAAKLFSLGPGQVTQLGVVLRDPDDLPQILRAVRGLIGGTPAAAYSWEQVLPELASYIAMDGGSNLVFQGLLLALIMFTIFNTILMSVLERRREFGVVLALGTPPSRLQLQILLESACLGLVGCAVGLALGGASAYLLQVYGLDMRSFMKEGVAISGVAVSPIIHARVTAGLLIVLGLCVFLATVLLSLYPMRRAARVPVADVLR
jgi:ABC-type lipoprotein release transport system permease subunit